jgi:NADP-dependent 3-hydroxy acid dehydrogenase YdfG
MPTASGRAPPVVAGGPGRAALPGRITALGLAPDILINNAGVSVVAQMATSVPGQQLNLVEVDVAAVVDLCSRFLPPKLCTQHDVDVLSTCATRATAGPSA